MRFFSNDKDARDDQQGVDVQERAEEVNPDQTHDNHPERVQSDPLAVPQQRAGSPWSSTPDTSDGPDSPGASAARDSSDPLRSDDSDSPRPDGSEVHDGDDPAPPDSSATETSEIGTGSHRAEHDQPVDIPLDDKDSGEAVREDTTPPDHAVSDTAPDTTADDSSTTTTYEPDGTVTTTDSDSVPDSDSATASGLKDDGDFSDPQAVDPVTDKPLDQEDSSPDNGHDSGSERDSTDSTADTAAAAPVAAAVPVAAAATPAVDSKPGEVPAPDLGTLFAADAAQSFRDRWREVQLQFVDSPKEATSEAARLVDEAVDKLTESLKSQKEALSGDHGEDTEKLRVELRGYRDVLNRILAL